MIFYIMTTYEKFHKPYGNKNSVVHLEGELNVMHLLCCALLAVQSTAAQRGALKLQHIELVNNAG